MKTLLAFLLILTTYKILAVPLDAGFFDNESPVLTYSGSWTHAVTSSIAINGTTDTSTAVSDTLTFDLFSEGFTLFYLFESDGADIEVCVDGDCIDLATVGGASNGRAEFTDLDYGLKYVSITNTDGNTFYFDGVYIYPTDLVTNNSQWSQQSYSFSNGGTAYTGVVDFVFSSGEIALVVILSVSLSIQIVRFVLDVWGNK